MGRGWGPEHLLEAILLRTVLVQSYANHYHVVSPLFESCPPQQEALGRSVWDSQLIHLEPSAPVKRPVCADSMNRHAVSKPRF